MTTSGGTQTSFCGWRISSEFGIGRWVGEGLLSLLFPPRCLLCGTAIDTLRILCEQCGAQLPTLDGVRCRRCQEPLDDSRLELCRSCGTRPRGFDLARSLGPYEGEWGELVCALKFERERAVARLLSAAMAAYSVTEEPFGAFEKITYVPMSGADQRGRGFNQARLLARGIGRRLKIPVFRLLSKVRQTPRQAVLPARERRGNLRGAFRLIRSGKGRVLLVDDIYTTGSTVEECARTLKSGGYEAVFVLTVARA